MSRCYIVLEVLVTLLLCLGQQGTASFYTEVNGHKTNCAAKENDVKLICKSNTSVSTIVIKTAHSGKVLYTSSEVSTSAEFLIKQADCKDVGEYQCIIDSKKTESTTLGLFDCLPMPCPGENANMLVYAEINTALKIDLCILIKGNVYSSITINNTSVKRRTEVNSSWTWDYFSNENTTDCFRNVTIVLRKENFTSEEYGKMNLRVPHSLVHYLDYNISFTPPVDEAPFSQSTITAKNQSLVEEDVDVDAEEANEAKEDLITFLPPFLVIALAVALTVVMIVRKEKRNKQREPSRASTEEQIISD